MSLTDLVSQFGPQDPNAAWAQHKNDFAAHEAAQEQAAYAAEMAEEKALGIGPAAEETPPMVDPTVTEFDGQDYLTASPASVKHALEHGRALVTLRSHATGKHVTILIVGRKKKPDGKGWVPRTHAAGRVGLGTGATALEVRDVLREYPDNYVGRLYLDTGEWKAGQSADGIRVWTAEKVLEYAMTGAALKSDVFLATQCAVCGKKLWDPESVERGIGPECYGKTTGSKVAH